MAATSKKPGIISKFWDYTKNRLNRTVFWGLKFTMPQKFLSPMGYSGMLTFCLFLLLGITGAFLMLFYVPGIAGAWDSVEFIDEEIPYGFAIRNIHYHASNAMVFMAVLHLYYQYFSGRYKIKNEMIWVTGMVLGVITILEAFTGYNLLFNDRAELAVSIGVSLTVFSPIVGPQLAQMIWGQGFSDFLIRLYALHVFIIPIVMGILMFVHFPRFLVFDLPMWSVMVGVILITGGIFPVEMGVKFDPNHPPGITVPEWYLTGLYAFIRTGFDKFITGGLLPALLIAMFLFVPFIDHSRKISWKDRPFFSALGIASISQVFITTIWGFYVNPDPTKTLDERLFVEPVPFYSVLLVSVVLSFVVVYGFLKARAALTVPGQKTVPTKQTPIILNTFWTYAVLILLVIFEVILNGMALMAYAGGLWALALFETGAIFCIFGIIAHVYRSYNPKVIEAEKAAKEEAAKAAKESDAAVPTITNSKTD